jgi:murein tripeptide amidase MpaA
MIAIAHAGRTLITRGVSVPAALVVTVALASAAQTSDEDVAALHEQARRLAAESDRCSVSSYGTSHQGRDLLVMTLSAEIGTADTRPAVLVTAGLDGRAVAGSRIALRVAEQLLETHAELLQDVTVYVVPLANPDGVALNASAVNAGHAGSLRPLDEDRDGRVDEDGPDDLNGDGLITMMRRPDPPLDDELTHLADPGEPRLLVEADPVRGDRPRYAVYVEGLDDDGDGLIAEDGPGGIDPDRNFMHEWPEHELDAGPYQLSEPESHALASFVLEHRNIVAAVTYGRHDNLINVPSGKGKDVSGRGPKVLDEGDVKLYQEMSKLFKELTGQKHAPKASPDGSFHAWLYAQRGVPSFATVVWGRPDPEAEEADEGDAGQPAQEETASSPEERDGAKSQKPRDEEAAAWLKVFDGWPQRRGFVEWQPFDHPTLGPVEIGGFAPGARMSPPDEELPALAEKQAAFVAALLERRPRLTVPDPTVKRLATGLYEVRFALVNEGFLPTATAMARKGRSVAPTVVRLDVPLEDIVAGERVSRFWGIDGSGQRVTLHWIVRVEDGATVQVQIVNPQLGDHTVTFMAGEPSSTEPPSTNQEDIP